MSGPSCGGAANANPSVGYALSLISATEEELEALDDDKLCLLSNKFQRLYSNRMSHRRGEKPQCYECGNTDHFIADCPQRRAQEKYSADKSDYKHKGEYISDKKKGKYKGDKKKRPYFSKREFMKQYQKHAQERDRAFLASLIDCDGSSSASGSDSHDDDEKKIVGHAGLCFFGEEVGHYTMVLKGEQASSTDSDICNKSNTEPQMSDDEEKNIFGHAGLCFFGEEIGYCTMARKVIKLAPPTWTTSPTPSPR